MSWFRSLTCSQSEHGYRARRVADTTLNVLAFLAGRCDASDMTKAQASVFLWFDHDAEDAARFYTATFPKSEMGAVQRSTIDYPGGKIDDAITVEATICSISFVLMNGGPGVEPNNSFSIQVHTETQEETDRLWHAIIDGGGQAQACGWCIDRWGYRWQITPRQLTEAIADPDRAAARRAMEAMVLMQKIDIAAIEAARRG